MSTTQLLAVLIAGVCLAAVVGWPLQQVIRQIVQLSRRISELHLEIERQRLAHVDEVSELDQLLRQGREYEQEMEERAARAEREAGELRLHPAVQLHLGDLTPILDRVEADLHAQPIPEPIDPRVDETAEVAP